MELSFLDPEDAVPVQAFSELLRRRFEASPEAFGAFSTGGRVVTLGEGGAITAFAILRDFRDPGLHIGSHMDMERVGDVLARPDIPLYQVALVHAEPGHELRDCAAELLRGFVSSVQDTGRFAIFITLMERANELAFPLWRELGFKPSGVPSRMMQYELNELAQRLASAQPLPASITPVFFDRACPRDQDALAACYADAFLTGGGGDDAIVRSSLDSIQQAGSFDPSLSLLLRKGERVVGFMLAERHSPERMHITVAGVAESNRGEWLPFRSFPIIAARALELGVAQATFITSQESVARMTARAFGAVEVDRLQTLALVG